MDSDRSGRQPRLTTPGWSLLELTVVLLIVGVLASLAWPQYHSHLRRGHRATAQAALLEAQHFMERHYAVHGRYTTAVGLAPSLPARLQAVPAESGARYRLALHAVTPVSYELRAHPLGDMAGDACGSLTLHSSGAKGRTGHGATVAQCWR